MTAEPAASRSRNAMTVVYDLVAAVVYSALWVSSWFSAYRRPVFLERSGRGAWEKIRNIPKKECVWVHASSMGEISGATPVVSALKAEFPHLPVIVTTTSLTGKAEATKRMPFVSAALLPIDRASVLHHALGELRPQLLLIAETEIWPGLYAFAQEREIPIVIFNGRVSDRAFPRYRRLRFFFKHFLAIPRTLLVQTQLDADRFRTLGAAADRVRVTGCTKYDASALAPSEGDIKMLRQEVGFSESDQIIVAGSIRKGEEQLMLDAYARVRVEFPNVRLIVAPRHPERFDYFANLLEARGLEFYRRSANVVTRNVSVLLLDTMGELERFYPLGDVCIVGGGFLPLGGHNPLEPARFSKSPIVGPHMANFRDAVSQLIAAQALTISSEAASLSAAISRRLKRPDESRYLGERAYVVWRNNQGATAEVMDAVRIVLGNRPESRRAVS